ncbi:DUF3291 domain-containing protein [Litoribacter alkaliphilus]|uniref:DUF3291 domain-containing protein n=1 Tax=Litoribacter ruber TaxID=702568 RepID=A0AAP2CJE7_9BACT|nr:DUF3291 domain-containing protein [Litoribacter alkaliphilus]MBS9525813.1 DUF3291 domain-containing protein [Litoribacter alkaliphilus]
MGTGAGFGFEIWPDFSSYALLIHWTDLEAAENVEQHPTFRELADMSESHETHWMQCARVHGSWNGVNPFFPSAEYQGGPIITITRARISWKYMLSFLKAVKVTVKALQNTPGLIYTKGIGQTPLVEQATFSIWENAECMENYAYRTRHQEYLEVNQQWFQEELFGRFVPVELP